MGICLPSMIVNAKQILKKHVVSRNQSHVSKGHIAVYVRESERKKFMVPISYLNNLLFTDLLNGAKEEFGFNHLMGGLTIPSKEEAFIDVTSRLHYVSLINVEEQ